MSSMQTLRIVCDYDDDMRNEVKLKQAWVYDYLDVHKENLERLWITEDHIDTFPSAALLVHMRAWLSTSVAYFFP